MNLARHLILLGFLLLVKEGYSEQLRLDSWNMSPERGQNLLERRGDIERLNATLQPDILVLIEAADEDQALSVAEWLGWDTTYVAVSDFARNSSSIFAALEVAVISKIPILRVTEFDASPDVVQTIYMNGSAIDDPAQEYFLSADGISGLSPLARSDRGTIRVDLENGLSIFPVHLKSNRNAPCIDVFNALRDMEDLNLFDAAETIRPYYENGFSRATREHIRNALKRERVIGAVKIIADAAIEDGRTVIIAGDFNASIEPGKAGNSFNDCQLQNFSCERSPFPQEACIGDGFDDTLAILTEPLVGDEPYTVLTRSFTRTYEDVRFFDGAIDHFAVPSAVASRFRVLPLSGNFYGSDHQPITATIDLAQ